MSFYRDIAGGKCSYKSDHWLHQFELWLFLNGSIVPALVTTIQRQLTALGSEEMRANGQRFFKEDVRLHGINASDVKRVGEMAISAVRNLRKLDVLTLCDALWKSEMLEESWIACELVYSRRSEFVPEDMSIFDSWLQTYVTNWASCDTLCNYTVAALVEMYPELVEELRTWTTSENRWKKRAAAVTLIHPARKGLFLADVFFITDALLEDGDDVVQKGYGWALKAASEAHRDAVYNFVVERRATMPPTPFRYALDKMPPDMRIAAMQMG